MANTIGYGQGAVNNTNSWGQGAKVGSSFSNTQSIELDGIDDYVAIADANNLSFGNGTTDSPFSISAWINMTDATSFRIVSKLRQLTPNFAEYLFSLSNSDKLLFQLYDNSNGVRRGKISATALTSYEGQWINVICTYDGRGGTGAAAGIKLYLNGSVLSTTDLTQGTYVAMSNTSQPLYIGAVLESAAYADGKIDEVAIFDVELSSTEVTNIYNSGTPNDISSISGLVSWWRFEGTGTTATDSGSGGNDGTLTNGVTRSSDVPT